MQAHLPLPNEYEELGFFSKSNIPHLSHKFDPNLLETKNKVKLHTFPVSGFFQHDFSSSVFSCVKCISLFFSIIVVVDHTFLISLFACISREGIQSWWWWIPVLNW